MVCLVVWMRLIVILRRSIAFGSQGDYEPDEKRKRKNAGKEYSGKIKILFVLDLRQKPQLF